MRAGSFCSGLGAGALGMKRAGCEIAFVSDNDKSAAKTLAKNFPDVPNLGDLTRINPHDALTPAALWLAGTPCQDFSVGNTVRRGLDGDRSGLLRHLLALARDAQPRWLLIENVPGLLTSNGGRDLGAVLGALEDIGYGWAYRVLDARYFGVPQRRRRIFILGHRHPRPRAGAVLLEPEVSGRDHDALEQRWSAHLSEAGPDPVLYRKSARTRGGDTPETWVVDGHTNTLNTWDGGDVRTTHIVVSGDTARRLTPLEHERLFGLPDGWTEGVSESARLHQLGNSCAVPVIEWITRRIIQEDAR